MRIAIDLQPLAGADLGGEAPPPEARLAEALVRIASAHEVSVLVDESVAGIDALRARLAPRVPARRVIARQLPRAGASADLESETLAGLVHEAAILGARPDVVWLCAWHGDRVASPAQWAGRLDTRVPLVASVLSAPPVGPASASQVADLQRRLTSLRRAERVLVPSDAVRRACEAALAPGRVPLGTVALPQGEGPDAWDAAAREVLAELQAAAVAACAAPVVADRTPIVAGRHGMRPRLALVAPMPPERTGIATYVAPLLPLLARWYEIELVVEQAAVDDAWARAHVPIREARWFERHAHRYDRVLYHVGNSPFHTHMFGLLRRHPGAVLLHDLALSDILDHLDRSGVLPGAYARELFRAHGYPGLRLDQRAGRAASVRDALCSRFVFDGADGVIVHSEYVASRADAAFGPDLAVRVVPHPRVLPEHVDRHAARARLGVAESDFVVCAFGLLTRNKLNGRLLEAWFASSLARDPEARLVFVGELPEGDHAQAVRAAIAGAGPAARVEITGFAEAGDYADWLAAADAAVQLRADTRGETSGTILDCLAHGLPTVVNAHGPAAELGEGAALLLPDPFADRELVEALERLRGDEALRRALSEAGRRRVRETYDPEALCARQVAAIEAFHAGSRHARAARFAQALAALTPSGQGAAPALGPPAPGAAAPFDHPPAPDAAPALDERALRELARCLAANEPATGPRQLLVDVTALVIWDLRTGIQRVVRAILNVLFDRPLAGWRVEPVVLRDGGYRYARRFGATLCGLPGDALADAPVEARPGDAFLGLDLVTHAVHVNEPFFARWRALGVSIHFVVYDLLPLQLPQFFPEQEGVNFRLWAETIARTADTLVCISRATADALRERLPALRGARREGPRVAWFHLGADLHTSLPSGGLPEDAAALLTRIGAGPAFLMVGTVEPRKGHRQALEAFERLWAGGRDATLVIVGRPGWMVDDVVARLRAHPELGRRLHWLEGASDEMLARLYETCAALLMASEGEGFGLPLIEAADHDLAIVARDLPVFREIAGDHAYYFAGQHPDALAQALERWLRLRAEGAEPRPAGLPRLTWEQSARDLVAAVLGQEVRWAVGLAD